MQETLAQAIEHIAVVAAAVGEAGGEQVVESGPGELVADKGYHSREVIWTIKEAEYERTFLSRSEEGSTGRGSSLSKMRFMAIAGESVPREASFCRDNGARNWSE